MTARIERLTDADYVGSEAHQEMIWTVDKGDARFSHHHKVLWQFQRGMVRHFAKLYAIPLYCAGMTSHSEAGSVSGSVRIMHAQYGAELHVEDWAIIGRRGQEYVESNLFPDWRGKRSIVWGGTYDLDEYDPARWDLSGFDEYIGDRR